MQKNDFRRALILLRPLQRGISGHARLERRTLTAMMRFAITGGVGSLAAVLLARADGGYRAHTLGALVTDARGQTGMTVTFDPRNLSGLDLDQYDLLAVVRTDGTPDIVLIGMMNGSREVDWQKARAAATAGFTRRALGESARNAPARAEPERVEPEPEAPEPEAPEPEAPEPEAPERKEAEREQPEREERERIAPTRERAAQEKPVREKPTQEKPVREKMDAPKQRQAPDVCQKATQVEEAEEEAEEAEEEAEEAEEEAEKAQEAAEEIIKSAAELLGLAPGAEWAEEFEGLRALFETREAFRPFELSDFVFVQAPLPNETGDTGICAIGLRAIDGKPASVCYALPGENTPEPPPGLEGYTYLGGWWYTVLEPEDDP